MPCLSLSQKEGNNVILVCELRIFSGPLPCLTASPATQMWVLHLHPQVCPASVSEVTFTREGGR